MIKKDLVYCGSFESKYKGKNYVISRFIDEQSLSIVSGTDIEDIQDCEKGDTVTCTLDIKGKKVVVSELS